MIYRAHSAHNTTNNNVMYDEFEQLPSVMGGQGRTDDEIGNSAAIIPWDVFGFFWVLRN